MSIWRERAGQCTWTFLRRVVRRPVLTTCLVLIAAAQATPVAASPQNPPAPAAGVASEGTPPSLRGPTVPQEVFTAADEAPGSRSVAVSFDSNFIADRLPFDVPFNVTGAVDQTVRRLELSVYRVPSNVDLAALILYLQNTVDCVGKTPQGRNFVRVSTSAASPGPGGRFSLFVNALDPQYFYALCFVGTSPVPGAEIEPDVRRILATTIPQSDTGGDITLALLTEIRAAMSDRIAQLGAGRPVPAVIPTGNLFDRASQQPRFGAIVRRLAEPYGNMAIQASNYSESLRDLTDALAEAQKSGTARIEATLAAVLPSPSLRLPTRESAITANRAFDTGTYTFDAALPLLDAAIRAAAPDSNELKVLQGLAADLRALGDAAKAYGTAYDALRGVTSELVALVALESREVTVTLGSSVLGADLARSVYVGLDAGIAYPWRLENMVFYAGANIYFRPINKAAPLRYKGTFLHRFALTVGITTTVKDDSRRARDLRTTDDDDTSNSLLLGAGIRITPSLRVGGGTLIFKESDPNPLIDQTSIAFTPYVSFTADVDVAQMFRSLF